ncbi:Aliphatic sulfonates import ATP-binding protein SsuB [bioreactor metagenome]|uniref:Aliphatic sulfonates import ATP-binding protein SsuB n=1 Tax=bioreactor metagenome TaxID=1076179 RepID=A0A645AI88_9ZZZZ
MRAEKLSKSYGDKRVIRDLTAEFPDGEITCVMGPSGCGKTTLLHMLMGLVKPDSGTVIGVPHRIAAVFQEERLCETASAAANVKLVCPPGDIYAHLAAVGLMGEDTTKPVAELSGGMRRRVAVVRALMSNGEALFIDEPFKGLDDETRALTIDYLKKTLAGRTAVVVTHDVRDVEALAAGLIMLEIDPDSE